MNHLAVRALISRVLSYMLNPELKGILREMEQLMKDSFSFPFTC